MNHLSFQSIISILKSFWASRGVSIIESYDMEVGAGTFHPATVLRCLEERDWNVAYVQPSRRPADSRYALHPNRMGRYYQFQVILKPSPDNIQELYLESLKELGFDTKTHDIRFIEDDWESPTLGASGLGWEVWCNGMEISQFTYMQQIGGIECRPIPGELTYGLERLALYLQDVDHIKDIDWNGFKGKNKLTYADIDFESERQTSYHNLDFVDTDMLFRHFRDYTKQAEILAQKNLPFPAYDYTIKSSHIFNLLDARGVISQTERASYIKKVRYLAKLAASKWYQMQKEC